MSLFMILIFTVDWTGAEFAWFGITGPIGAVILHQIAHRGYDA